MAGPEFTSAVASAQRLGNIRAICELERQALNRRSAAARLSDAVARIAGRFWFFVLHVVWFLVWIAWNSGVIRVLRAFDRFPYSALTTVVSLEAIFLTLILLMSQNRAGQRGEERSHLDLQINLLAELEATKSLVMLRAVCRNLGLPEAEDPELAELLERIEPEVLAHEIDDQRPENEAPPVAG